MEEWEALYQRQAEVLKALAHPVRLRIVRRLPERQLYGAGYGPVPVGYFPTLEPPQARWGVGVCPVRQ